MWAISLAAIFIDRKQLFPAFEQQDLYLKTQDPVRAYDIWLFHIIESLDLGVHRQFSDSEQPAKFASKGDCSGVVAVRLSQLFIAAFSGFDNAVSLVCQCYARQDNRTNLQDKDN